MTSFPRPLAAVIFDLDGVLADTAGAHFSAWKRLAEELGRPLDEAVGERLKGVDRFAALDILLGEQANDFSAEEKGLLAERKNRWYRQSVNATGPQDLLPGAKDALSAVRRAGLRMGLASASRNAALLVERLGIGGDLDHVVDAADVANGKPSPDLFLAAAAALGTRPALCLGIEDAVAGIEAVNRAGMASLGIGRAATLPHAHAVIGSLAEFRLDDYFDGVTT